MNTGIIIDENALYLGAKSICNAIDVSRNTLKKYMDKGLKVRRDENGKLVATGKDLLEYFRGLPLAKEDACG